ncbi:hypothetical protein [Bacillus sp. 1NLA3E]|uniref:hypothetical protein n=1 Tax=Bacillus sp. 1NLA3E TaxID=666686 RepID=UPI00191C3EE1|nr:hypothetical protein [Bacillus sp. 1NLA3E]
MIESANPTRNSKNCSMKSGRNNVNKSLFVNNLFVAKDFCANFSPPIYTFFLFPLMSPISVTPVQYNYFFLLGCLKLNVDFLHNVDWSGRHEDSCGSSGTGETPQALKRRGGSPPAPRKASAWNGNQHSILIEPFP